MHKQRESMENLGTHDTNSQTLGLFLPLGYSKMYIRLKNIKRWKVSGFYSAPSIYTKVHSDNNENMLSSA